MGTDDEKYIINVIACLYSYSTKEAEINSLSKHLNCSPLGLRMQPVNKQCRPYEDWNSSSIFTFVSIICTLALQARPRRVSRWRSQQQRHSKSTLTQKGNKYLSKANYYPFSHSHISRNHNKTHQWREYSRRNGYRD